MFKSILIKDTSMFSQIFLSHRYIIPSKFLSGSMRTQVNNLWRIDGEKDNVSNFNFLPEINKSCFLIELDLNLERG